MASGNTVVVQKQRQAQRPTAKGLGITTDRPKFPHYAQLAKRHESFHEHNWPSSVPVTVDDLVEAGLVYTGVGDSVRCFYCGGGLRNWEKGDKPMVEHARWYPNCPHVALAKGKKFIDMIADGELPEEDCDNSLAVTTKRTLVSLDDLNELPAVKALIEMDFDKELVYSAVRVFTDRTGQEKFSATDLVGIIDEIEKNPSLRITKKDDDDSDARSDSGFESGDEEELKKENERLKQDSNCKICLAKLADIIFLPCGHVISCAMCAPALETCPVCRKKVSGLVKAYFATIPKEEK